MVRLKAFFDGDRFFQFACRDLAKQGVSNPSVEVEIFRSDCYPVNRITHVGNRVVILLRNEPPYSKRGVRRKGFLTYLRRAAAATGVKNPEVVVEFQGQYLAPDIALWRDLDEDGEGGDVVLRAFHDDDE